MRRVLILSLAFLFALPLAAAELAGVRMDDRTRVGEHDLVLNGLGLRKKLFVKVYVGGLYLPAKQSDARQILAADTPRRMVMEFVRSVGKDSICGGWDDCLAANTPDASSGLQRSFADLCAWMEDVDDDAMVFTYAPESGTEVTVKGTVKGTIAGKEFADALFACWIGPSPPSQDFKDGLLGNP